MSKDFGITQSYQVTLDELAELQNYYFVPFSEFAFNSLNRVKRSFFKKETKILFAILKNIPDSQNGSIDCGSSN